MNELSAMYKIPEGKTASKILKIYLKAARKDAELDKFAHRIAS